MTTKQMYTLAYRANRVVSNPESDDSEVDAARATLSELGAISVIAAQNLSEAHRRFQNRLQFVLNNPPWVMTEEDILATEIIQNSISIRMLRNPIKF